MGKFATKGALIFVIVGILIYISLRYFLIPSLVTQIEQYICHNTPYKVEIANPEFMFTHLYIPQVKLHYKDKIIYIHNIKLKIKLLPLLHKTFEIKGKGELSIEKQLFPFILCNLNYRWEQKLLRADIELKERPFKSYLTVLTYFITPKFTGYEASKGKVLTVLHVKSEGRKFDINVSQSIKGIKLTFKEWEISVPSLSLKLKGTKGEWKLEAEGNNFKLIPPIKYFPILTNGSFALITDFRSLQLTNVSFYTNGTQLKGTCNIKSLKTPIIEFQLGSDTMNIDGELRKSQNTLFYSLCLEKGEEVLEGKGSYILDEKILKFKGSGQLNFPTFLSLFKVKYKILKQIYARLIVSNLRLTYGFKRSRFVLDLHSQIKDLRFRGHQLADEGELILKGNEKVVNIEECYLKQDEGKINIRGDIHLRGENSFLSFMVDNYSFKTLTMPFLNKDIGDAILTVKGYIKGNIRDKNKLKALVYWRFENGEIGKLRFLSYIAQILSKPELEEISFKQGKGKICLRDKRFLIKETSLISPYLEMYSSGYIDLDGNLDITVITNFPQPGSLWDVESPWAKLGTILFTGIKELLYKIKITGTLKNSKYVLIPATIDKILMELIPKLPR